MEHQQAVQFTTTDQHGNTITLEQYRGKKVVLYFYPKDMTPGCTTEALGFQDLYNTFKKHNTEILAVSKDNQASHQKFCDKHGLEFPLLVDEDGTLVQAYGVWKEKSMYGKTYMGISRESFLIDEHGVMVKHWDNVKPATHPQEVLDYITNM
ncbi:thioredoxin-dependent thiol peroxidase [Patescibacteria group bacterium]|nr:thioredoxin-dependent thiol peroxidase [Patescibacteria group bacterium]